MRIFIAWPRQRAGAPHRSLFLKTTLVRARHGEALAGCASHRLPDSIGPRIPREGYDRRGPAGETPGMAGDPVPLPLPMNDVERPSRAQNHSENRAHRVRQCGVQHRPDDRRHEQPDTNKHGRPVGDAISERQFGIGRERAEDDEASEARQQNRRVAPPPGKRERRPIPVQRICKRRYLMDGSRHSCCRVKQFDQVFRALGAIRQSRFICRMGSGIFVAGGSQQPDSRRESRWTTQGG